MMLLITAFSSLVFAQDFLSTEERLKYYQFCKEECALMYDNPGHGLQSCLDQCALWHLLPPNDETAPRTPNWCETYEDDCERGPNEF